MALPTGSDLAAFMLAAGVIDELPADLSLYDLSIGSAIAEFKNQTGYTILEGTSTTRYYHPDGSSLLFLDEKLQSLTSVVIAGTTYTLNTDFWFYPLTAPYTKIEWAWNVGGERRSIVITGVFGLFAADSLGDDVRLALLSKAAMERTGSANGVSGAVKREKQGPVETEYSGGGGPSEWFSVWTSTVNRYRRIVA